MSELALSPELLRRIVEWRRTVHRNPELSHQERETSAFVRRELEAAGITEVSVVGDTAGLVATVRGVGPGPTLAFRAELDALPQDEATGLAFASSRPGVMHACGHDGHLALVLGVAVALHENRSAFRGAARCIFQPAEEAEPLGARDVLIAGGLDGVDAILGFHMDPELPVGTVGGLVAGPRAAASDELTLVIRGRASHAARPHVGVDAIAVAAAVVQELQKIPSRCTDPLEPVLITIGEIHGGKARNILADTVTLTGIIRTLSPEVRKEVAASVERIAGGVARAHGAEAEVHIVEGEPVLMNDARLTRVVEEAALSVLGAEHVVEGARPAMGADDFAFYAARVPGTMVRLGASNAEKGIVYPLHHPRFTFDEDALAVGTKVALAAAARFFETWQR